MKKETGAQPRPNAETNCEPNITTGPAQSQSELPGIPIPTKRKRARGADPNWKPTWSEWCSWDKYRRILNDDRVPDAGFRLYHWYDNTKDSAGEVSGFRAEAWFIARKFGWARRTVYALNRLLQECGYLSWRATQGCRNIYTALKGIGAIPTDSQREFPFLLPVKSGGTGCASTCTPGAVGVPQSAHQVYPKVHTGCASTCTPTIVNSIVSKECDKTAPPTPYTIKTIIEAKEALAADLRASYCVEVAMGEQWTNAKARQNFRKLKQEIKELQQRLSALKI